MFQLVKLEHQLCAQGSLVSSGTPQGTGGGGDQATKDEAHCPLCAVHFRAPNITSGLQRPQKQWQKPNFIHSKKAVFLMTAPKSGGWYVSSYVEHYVSVVHIVPVYLCCFHELK